MGYTPQYITEIRVGFGDEASLGKGETGSRAAAPIRLCFMKEVHKEKRERLFEILNGIVYTKIDAKTVLLFTPESKNTIFECFKENTVPTEYVKYP